jgi:hypothetical protein
MPGAAVHDVLRSGHHHGSAAAFRVCCALFGTPTTADRIGRYAHESVHRNREDYMARKLVSSAIAILLAAAAVTIATSSPAAASHGPCRGLANNSVVTPPWVVSTIQAPSLYHNQKRFHCTLRRGDQGWGVVALQISLRNCYHEDVEITGVYNAQTQGMVMWVQAYHNRTVDGIYGPVTRSAMNWWTKHEGPGAVDYKCERGHAFDWPA